MRRVNPGRVVVAVIIVAIVGAVVYAVLAPRAGTAPVSARRSPTSQVYAYVGNHTVLLSDLERAYATRNPSQQNLTLAEYFNASYAPRTMLLLDAARQGMTVNSSEIDATIKVINATLASKNVSFQTYLDGLNETMTQLRIDIGNSYLLNKILTEEVASKVNVTAAEVEEAYNASGYAKLGIPLDQARNEIGPKILQQKQDALLHKVISNLSERYAIRYP